MSGLVTNMSQYRELLLDLLDLGDEPLAVDTETTGLRPWLDTVLRGVCLAYRDKSWYVPLTHPQSENLPARPLAEALNQTWARPFVYHNRNYDVAILERGLGLEPRSGVGAFWDTALVDWLLEENAPHALKKIGARLFGEDADEEQRALKERMKAEPQTAIYKRLRQELAAAGIKEPAAITKERAEALAAPKRTWADLTAVEIAPYAAKDAELTLRLYRWQQTAPGIERVRPAIDREYAVQEAVYRMMKLGIRIDRPRVAETRERSLHRMEEIEVEFDPVNIGSHPQLRTLVYETWGLDPLELTKGGKPSTSKDALELHAGAHPGLDLILEYRHHRTAVSTYFDALLENVDENDRVHTSLNTAGGGGDDSKGGTVTGRFSSSDPNLQNIPREGTNSEVRDVFIAAEGYELWSFDMSQAELRIAASLAGEQSMLDRFTAGEDIYQGTANDVFDCNDECPRDDKGHCKTHRQPSKVVVLSSGYGIGARKLARDLLKGTGRKPTECEYWMYGPEDRWEMKLRRCYFCDVCRTKELLENFWGSVPQLGQMNRRLIDFAETRRYVPLHVPGRFRNYPTHAECRALGVPARRWPKPYTAMNSVVQGGCAEVLKSWILVAEKVLPPLGARLVLTVHDSLVVELLPGTMPNVLRALQAALDSAIPQGWCAIPIEPKEGV